MIEFGAATLIGCEDNGQTCVNGLPIVSSSTRMLSRFTKLMGMSHEYLCKYIELIRCQTVTNGVILVSENGRTKFNDYLNSNINLNSNDENYLIAYQIASAINYCHENLLIMGLLTLDNIYFEKLNQKLRVKISQYGLYYVSGENFDVDYLIGSPWYLAPERLALSNNNKCSSSSLATFKSDIWSYGICLLEIFARKSLSQIWGQKQILSILCAVIRKANKESILTPLLDAMHFASNGINVDLPEDIFKIIEGCLQVYPSKRPNSTQLLKLLEENYFSSKNLKNYSNLLDESIEEITRRIESEGINNIYFKRPLNELFFLWKLCGSSVESILIKRGILRMKPPISTIPCLIMGDLQLYGNENSRKVNTSFEIFPLPNKNLEKRLKSIPLLDLCESFELNTHSMVQSLSSTKIICIESRSSITENENSQISIQTLVVKERDIDYQANRMRLFEKLLRSYPFKSKQLFIECKKDIPPIYRGAIWAVLLNVYNKENLNINMNFDDIDDEGGFYTLDTFSEHPSDRQLQVDIPRCHQYDELMTTPAAHIKLKILLKSWLLSKQTQANGYVYWQGLDSLATPFLVLNFNNLPTAFHCLSAFIDRFLNNFFLKDNSEVIQEYLEVFMLLVEYLDPELGGHLNQLEFKAHLFAIPWFLTCFAHVLPLHKLFHLWDSLLLADATFPLFIGVAILNQLRPQLILAQFNDAILLFSDLPDLSIDNVVVNSLKFFNSIPSTCTHPNTHNFAKHCISNLQKFLSEEIQKK